MSSIIEYASAVAAGAFRRRLFLTIVLSILSATVFPHGHAATPAQTPKARITSASGVRMRSAPNTSAAEVARLPVGTVVRELGRSAAKARVGEETDYWYRVATDEGTEGWIFGALTADFDPSRRDEIYTRLSRTRIDYAAAGFGDMADTVRFLERALKEVTAREAVAELEHARLIALARSFANIEMDSLEKAPYKAWLKEHEAAVVYSEPAGQYYLRSELLWDLQKKYAGLAVAERAAWDAANNPLPGECEGYLTCMLYLETETNGRYVQLYPNGANVGDAASRIADLLRAVADDKEDPPLYQIADEDRPEARKILAQLRTQIKTAQVSQAAEARALLDRVEARFK